MQIRNKKRETPEVSTASLPDIIFMLLFFFMTVTVLRTASAQFAIVLPATEAAHKIAHEATEYNIYVRKDQLNQGHEIQINEYLVSIAQLNTILKNLAAPLMDFEKMKVPIYLRIDKDVQMKMVYDIKLMLRKHGLRKINYIVERDKT